ncbi:MAG: polymorphic toxin-type HINT domain-containing protein [Kibdelosporangium sp.]
MRAWERSRDVAAEAGAKADQLQGRVFNERFRGQLAEGARQRQASSPDVLLGRPLPATPVTGAAQGPDPRREAIEAQRELPQAQEQQRQRREAEAQRARARLDRANPTPPPPPAPPPPQDKNFLEMAEETAEEVIGGAFTNVRQLAEDEITAERNDPNKIPDPVTGARRILAGAYSAAYDGAQVAGEGLDLLDRAASGDQEAQRQIEQGAENVVNGVAQTVVDAWNDPQRSLDGAVDGGRQAVDNFLEAPLSGAGALIPDVVGAGKIIKPLKGADAAVPGRRDGGSPTPNSGSGTQPGGVAAPNSGTSPDRTTGQSAPTPAAAPNSAPDGAVGRGAPRAGTTPDKPREQGAPRAGTGRATAGDAGRRDNGAPQADKDRNNQDRGGQAARPNDRDKERGVRVLPAPATQLPTRPPASSANTPRRDTSADDNGNRQQPDEPKTGAPAARETAEAATQCATPNSFVPGTLVRLADGTYKPIEQVKLGDRVLATDPTTGITQSRPVLALIPGSGLKELVRVTVDTDGDRGDATGTVTATDTHPFWVANTGRWTDAEDLERDNTLRTPDGQLLKIVAVHEWAQQQQVHNLTVEGLHTYYVNVGGQDVLTHNDTCTQLPSPLNSKFAVIGRLPDTGVAKSWGDHEVLSLKRWSPRQNRKWVQGVIAKKQPVYLASPIDSKTLIDEKTGRPSVYSKEINQLLRAGYTFSYMGTRAELYMIPTR